MRSNDLAEIAAVPPESSRIQIEQLLRELTPLVVGSVVRRFHDFASAEDAVQEASLDAAVQCASTWRYNPAKQKGQPIEMDWKASVRWQLKS